MAINLADNNPRIAYSVAEGVSQTVFAVPFEFFEDSDINVYVDGVEKTEGTDYTLSGGEGSTGTLTFTSAVTGASGGSAVVMFRRIAIERTTDFQIGQDINRTALNEQLDTLTALVADMNDRWDRTLKISDFDPDSVDLALPAKASRVEKYLGFNADGEPVMRPGTVNITTESLYFASRSELPASGTYEDGVTVFAGGFAYTANSSSTVIPDKLGWVPAGDVAPQHFGAVGDGVTDDLVAIQAAVDSAANVIDGGGLTYKISDTIQITRGDLVLQNANFVGPLTGPISSAALRPTFIEFNGAQGSNISLTADAARGDNQITVASTAGLAVDQWVRLQSDEVLWGSTNKGGELAKIKAIAGSTLTFYDALYLNYTLADSSNIAPLDTLENIVVRDCSIAGDPATSQQTGIRFNYCANVSLENFRSTDCQYSHIVFATCADAKVLGGQGERTSTAVGLNYGVSVLFASNNVVIDGYTGRTMRHTVTTGGSNGINRYVKAINCVCLDQLDAGLDAHPSTAEVNYSFNYVSIQTGAGSVVDGIICQGEQFTAIGNSVYNVPRFAIFHQPLMAYTGNGAEMIVSDNIVEYIQAPASAASIGIYASTDVSGSVFKSVNITGNRIKNAPIAVNIYAKLASIENTTVANNIIQDATVRSIYYRSNAGTTIERNSVVGNICTQAGGSSEGIYFFGAGGAVNYNTAEANVIDGASIAIRALDTTTTRIGDSNVYLNVTNEFVQSGDTDTIQGGVIYGETTYDPPSLLAGERDVTTLTVAGVQPGDLVIGVSHSTSLFSGDIVMSGHVVGTDSVLVVYQNQGTVTRDIASGTLRVMVKKSA